MKNGTPIWCNCQRPLGWHLHYPEWLKINDRQTRIVLIAWLASHKHLLPDDSDS